jgi:vesicle transport protein SEC22
MTASFLCKHVSSSSYNGCARLQNVELTHNAFLLVVFQVIQRKRRDFLDPSSRDNMARLNNDLADIHDIMKKNIQEVL